MSLIKRCPHFKGVRTSFGDCKCVVINPRRACAVRVMVVILCVCLSVYLSPFILALQALNWVMSDTNGSSATSVQENDAIWDKETGIFEDHVV